ncbi:MAG: SocA family protein [Candidatus Tectomicrobia bacterium]|nr:SocA family protein [Candidatus Tectomicrobia bacterium]MBI3026052.1 SocA family protein [Candidatus Tectomicrobia bacterium]
MDIQKYLDSLHFEFPEKDGEARLKELVLYISMKCESFEFYGKTKLNKILYLSDFKSYENFGQPITGVAYQRLPAGPAPKKMLPILESMKKSREITIRPKSMYDYTQERIIALRSPDLSVLSARDIALIDEAIEKVKNDTAAEVSKRTHGIAWEVADNQELIPYEAALLADEGITADDIIRSRQLKRELAWDD